MEIIDHIGSLELLKLQKTAFLCSREIPASIVLKCYDWAIAQREQGNCIISGFHSKIEKDVLHYLLKGDQPIIIAMARGLKQRIEPEFKQSLQKGRILIISPFEKEVKRITTKTALIRNQLMIELADKIIVGFISKGGNLEGLLKQTDKKLTEIK
jgi:predicted Rossmann fold nucleotide-binding protein DprA/Smf involved in DNA uptake